MSFWRNFRKLDPYVVKSLWPFLAVSKEAVGKVHRE